MNLLAFDTATHACTVALSVNGQPFVRHVIAPREHANLILTQVESLRAEAGIALDALDAIAFGAGPGSFMGVRLATAVAQGIGFGVKKPLIGISTLQTLAQTAFMHFGVTHILAGWDARMDEVYWGAYEIVQGVAEPLIEDTLSAPSKIDLKSLSGIRFALVGNAWEVYASSFSGLFSDHDVLSTTLYPEAVAMLTLAKAKYEAHALTKPEAAEPHYIRHHVVRHSA